jgi:predicted permease
LSNRNNAWFQPAYRIERMGVNPFKLAMRQMRKHPGFSVVVVLLLGLSIGANLAVFSVVRAIQFRRLPVRNAHELRVLNWAGPLPKSYRIAAREAFFVRGQRIFGEFSYPVLSAFRDHSRGLLDVFAFAPTDSMTAVAGGIAFSTEGLLISGNFFDGYGARPFLGRPILPEDDRLGASPAVVITWRMWEQRFGMDPHVVGQTVTLNQQVFTVVGVLPRRFAGPLADRAAEIYIPFAAGQRFSEWSLESRDHYWIQIMLRLPQGAGEAQARSSLEVVFQQCQADLTEPDAAPPCLLLKDGRCGPWIERLVLADPLRTLMRVSGLVLVVACANVASLLLARNASRHHETAIRAALGAGWLQLVRQHTIEAAILAASGAALGLLLAGWGKVVLASALPALKDAALDLQTDTTMVVFTAGIVVGAALVFGLALALWDARVSPVDGLKEARSVGKPRLRLGRGLVVIQVAMSLVLVAGAGLLTRTLIQLRNVELGFDADHLLLVKLNALQAGYDALRLPEFYERTREALAAIPGVNAVAFSDQSQLGAGYGTHTARVQDRHESLQANYMMVSDRFFSTLKIPLLMGRDFSTLDGPGALRAAIVNQRFVDLVFPGVMPLGQTFKAGGQDYEIVGVCADARYHNVRWSTPAMTYLEYRQRPTPEVWFQISSVLPHPGLAAAVRECLGRMDRNLGIAALTTQTELADRGIAEERLLAGLVGGLSMLAMLLSCLGVYGLMAYNVARRRSEFGVRMALGARPSDVTRSVLRDALWLAALGVGFGLPAAVASARVLRHVLYETPPHDPLVLGAAVLVLLAVAMIAAWIPARRASQIDPMEALRSE